jgi:hypothetical protein
MVAAYRRYVALGAAERRLVVEALVLMAIVRVCLGRRSILEMRRILSRWLPRSRGQSSQAGSGRIQWAVAAAARRIPGATCLVQALTADALLKRRGMASEVRLGVRRADERPGSFEAHAWVVSDEQIVVGGVETLPDFTVLSRLKAS